MIKFEVGQVYYGELTLVCTKRTAKTVSFKKLNGDVERKTLKISPNGYEYVSFLGYNVHANHTEKRWVVDQPVQTPHNTHLFFNGVYLDPAVEF